jgi:hypothetical protein
MLTISCAALPIGVSAQYGVQPYLAASHIWFRVDGMSCPDFGEFARILESSMGQPIWFI